MFSAITITINNSSDYGLIMTEKPTTEDIERTLYLGEEVHQRVAELASQISSDYAGKEIHTITILKGADAFANDLVRQINLNIPLFRDYMVLSSYQDEFDSSGKVKVVLDLGHGIKNRDVLVIEDIVDTGHTLDYLVNSILFPRRPSSIRVCSLLSKPSKRKGDFKNLKIDYLGFEIEDAFVVGYGLDYKQYCRNWPFIAELKEEFYRRDL